MISLLNKKIIWNCWGATSSAFNRYCNQYMDSYKSDILVILRLELVLLKLKELFLCLVLMVF